MTKKIYRAIVLAAAVPWSIAGSVPLEAMGASALAIPFSFFLFAAPVCDWLLHRGQFQMEQSRSASL